MENNEVIGVVNDIEAANENFTDCSPKIPPH